jgi:glycosyltransferase involved in cell wall biosynthesis
MGFPIIPRLRHWDAKLLFRRLLPVARRIHARFRFDVITAEFFWPEGPAVMRLAQTLKLPYSIKGRGADFLTSARDPRVKRQMLEAALAAGGILAVSEGLKAEMINHGIPPEAIRVHLTGIDRDLFHIRPRAGAKATLGLVGQVLLIVGNLVPSKGQLWALDALPHLPGVTLLVAGRGPDLGRLQKRIRELELGERVRLLGLVTQADMPLLYAAADVTIHASTVEGLSNVLVESLACGTPVVMADVCGARETLHMPTAGRIVERDPASLAAAVRDALENVDEPLAVAAAVERFSWERNALELREHCLRVAFGGDPRMTTDEMRR